jgi:hypothetical protein
VPHYDPSWRADRPRLRWASRLLCLLRIHHWLKSRRMRLPLLCVVCGRKTENWDAYRKRFGLK